MATHSSFPRIFPQLKSYARLNSLTDRVDVAFYDVKFYPFSEPDVDPVFAVVGGPEAIVCRPLAGENGGVEVIAWFHDEEPEANLNSVTWSQNLETGDPLLVVSGTSPIIKVFDVKKNTLVQTLVGHGKGINDLAVSPLTPQILASASMDKSVRFWSLDPAHAKQPTVLICGGEGHKESILTFAFHPTGRFLLTGGMDHMINLWLLPTSFDSHAGTDHPAQIRYPHFTSSAIHTDYVDCVAWYGDLILSKCAREHTVVLWRIEGFSSTDPLPDEFFAPTTHEFRPTRSAWNGSFQRLLEFSNPDCDLFFIRFTLYTGPPYAKRRSEYMSPYAPSQPATSNGPIPARERPILAVGNEKSKISFWDLSAIETWSGEPDDEPLTKTGKKRGRPSKHGAGTPTSALAARNRRKEEGRGGAKPGRPGSPTPSTTTTTTRQASNEAAAAAAAASAHDLAASAARHQHLQPQPAHPLSASHTVVLDGAAGPSTPAAAASIRDSPSGQPPFSHPSTQYSSSYGTPAAAANGSSRPFAPDGASSAAAASGGGFGPAAAAAATAGGPGPGPGGPPSSTGGTAGSFNSTPVPDAPHSPSSSTPPTTTEGASGDAAPGTASGTTTSGVGTTSSSSSARAAASKFARTSAFVPLVAHRTLPIPKTTFAVRAIAWSNDGSFAVGVGDQGVVALFAR